ncbi:MAG: ankyrin repeat domain-containing protein, partial [Ignavibacteria bacterium]|nr:ankyrin repeat domain-containing protein [Ignavibacteria bacterium]
QIEIARLLLEKGAAVDATIATTGQNHTPLFFAIMRGGAPMVKLLLEKGANPNLGAGSRPISPLALAILREDQEIVEALLLNPNTEIGNPQVAGSPIKIAQITAQKDNSEMLELLKKHRMLTEAEVAQITDDQVSGAESEGETQIDEDDEGYTEICLEKVEIEEMNQELEFQWAKKRDKKERVKNRYNGDISNAEASPISEKNISGANLKVRELLKLIFVDKPHGKIRGVEIGLLIKRLGGEVKITKKNHHTIYFANKKMTSFYEVMHGRDLKGCLTRDFVIRVAKMLKQALDEKIIPEELAQLFPSKIQL